MGEYLAEKFIWHTNIKRLNTWNKVVLFIHLALLFTSDLYNYVNQIWDVFPSQFYVFMNHVCSLPILGALIYYNSSVLKKIESTSIARLKWLLVANILICLPMLLIYYYWDLVDYTSSGIMMIYICAVGFLFRFPKRQIMYMTLFLAAIYFGMLFFVRTSYKLNPSLYLNGIAILAIYFSFSKILYQSEHKIFESNFNIEQKNSSLKVLNKSLSKSEHRIKKQNKILREQNKSLDNFATIVAHDIKAPLKMITNLSGLLSKKYKNQIEEKDQPLFDFIADGSENLIGIVDGLYDFTKIATNTNLQFGIIDLNYTIKRSLALMSHEFDENKVQVFFKQNFPKVSGIEELLQNVFLNLFSNAIKFKRNDIDATIEISCQLAENRFIEICVKDNGIGMPKEAEKEVFQLFRKLHLSSQYDGFGIGLATCKRIVEKHNGKIWIDATENKGTAVYFNLPVAKNQNKKKNSNTVFLKHV